MESHMIKTKLNPKSVDRLLKEQDRNTRHDATEVVTNYLTKMSSLVPTQALIFDSISQELIRDIMNMRIRMPDLVETIRVDSPVIQDERYLEAKEGLKRLNLINQSEVFSKSFIKKREEYENIIHKFEDKHNDNN